MSNPWTKSLSELIARQAKLLTEALDMYGNANQLLNEDPEKANTAAWNAQQKVDEGQGVRNKITADLRAYQAMHYQARDLLAKLGHRPDEPGYDKRLEETLKALNR